MAKNIDFMGAVYSDVPSVRLPQQGGGLVGFDDTTDATATAEDIAQGKTAYVNGQKVTGTGTGSTPVINPLSVTENGTYTAPSGVDGYSPVTVNVSGGGGGQEDEIIARTISGTYVNDRVAEIGNSAFAGCGSLISASFGNALTVGGYAFQSLSGLQAVDIPMVSRIYASAFKGCSKLSLVSAPRLEDIGPYAFYACYTLTAISFSLAENIGSYAFTTCLSLRTANLPNVQIISTYAFSGCYELSEIIFGENISKIYPQAFARCSRLINLDMKQASSVPTLSNSNAFSSTPIGGYSASAGQFGSIYVPASLYSAFQSATNWQYFSSRMVSV